FTPRMKKTAYGSAATLLLAIATLVIPALASSPATAKDDDAVSRTATPVARTASVPKPAPAVQAPKVVPAPPAQPASAAFPSFDAPGLRPHVLSLALEAAGEADRRGLVKRPELLTVIDYSLPSTEERLWVLDLERGRVLYHELTTHGQGSGGNMATEFSNVSMSLKSNLGLMTTSETYYGKNGYSLRLDGHEQGFNDQARPRAIVIHGADYATPAFISRIGRLGRSWGCPALDPKVSRQLIDTIKGGSGVFGYYPSEGYLTKSAFLGDAGAEVLRTATQLAP
ncbi:MAG TPA: murein L,D-transpeptidase catalytic domain family protein, partial [Thermoanaerobaculia bacterium]|nr:murein L,D-transpeptidase catalytic domain family protein [Thermoanaerobaculia bacterium]